MTDNQPEALRLADALEKPDDSLRWADGNNLIPQAAEELRRLHAEVESLREAAQMALDVLEEWDDLIEHQYTGSRAAMTDMHYAAQATLPAMDALREALGDKSE